MSRAKKNVCVLIFDLNQENKETAIGAFMKICGHKFFIGSNDLMKVILINSSKTKNLYGYKGIHVVDGPITNFDPKNYQDYFKSAVPEPSSNWLEAIQTAIKGIAYGFDVKNIESRQILFLTDLKLPVPDRSILSSIVEEINNENICLYFVGPDVEMPFTISEPSNIKPAMVDIGDTSDSMLIAKELSLRTAYSVICNYKDGIHLFHSFKTWTGSQPWNVPIRIGTQIGIPASTMKYLAKGVKCKITKHFIDNQLKQTLWLDAEDETKRYDFDQVVKGITRHGKFVPRGSEIRKQFKTNSPRSLNILGFTSAENVPEYYMGSEATYTVLPHSKQPQAFNLLVDKLAEKNMYMIGRRVYNNGNKPKFVALIPKPTWTPKCFILTQLPYADDIRVDYKEQKYQPTNKDDRIDEVYRLLDSLDVISGNIKVPLQIRMVLDPNNGKIINKALDKYLERNLSLDDFDCWDYLNLKRNKKVEEAAQQLFSEREPFTKIENLIEDPFNSDNDFDFNENA